MSSDRRRTYSKLEEGCRTKGKNKGATVPVRYAPLGAELAERDKSKALFWKVGEGKVGSASSFARIRKTSLGWVLS